MLMGVTDYARHRGVGLQAIQYAVSKGRIKRRPDGLIEVEQADIDWAKTTRPFAGPGRPRKKRPAADPEPKPAVLGRANGMATTSADPAPRASVPESDPNAPANGRVAG